MILPVLLTAAAAVTAPCAAGTWDFLAGGQVIFRLEIKTAPIVTAATWDRPKHFETDGENFSRLSGPPVRRTAQIGKLANGDVEISFDDPALGASPDVFHLRCVNVQHLDVLYEGTGFAPLDFIRVQARAAPLGPWDADRNYAREIVRTTNAEMTAIFDSDQADRKAQTIDWSVVGLADEKRRDRTRELLKSGALQSGNDFYHAAFIYQHGNTPDDFLNAHLLAIIAVARGRPGAVWIASATLDRYLQASGKPQVLGTQYTAANGAPATQEPFDRALVSDAMRKALHVPTFANQEEQAHHYSGHTVEPVKP